MPSPIIHPLFFQKLISNLKHKPKEKGIPFPQVWYKADFPGTESFRLRSVIVRQTGCKGSHVAKPAKAFFYGSGVMCREDLF